MMTYSDSWAKFFRNVKPSTDTDSAKWRFFSTIWTVPSKDERDQDQIRQNMLALEILPQDLNNDEFFMGFLDFGSRMFCQFKSKHSTEYLFFYLTAQPVVDTLQNTIKMVGLVSACSDARPHAYALVTLDTDVPSISAQFISWEGLLNANISPADFLSVPIINDIVLSNMQPESVWNPKNEEMMLAQLKDPARLFAVSNLQAPVLSVQNRYPTYSVTTVRDVEAVVHPKSRIVHWLCPSNDLFDHQIQLFMSFLRSVSNRNDRIMLLFQAQVNSTAQTGKYPSLDLEL